ncbi:unnamed protein product [Rhizophagus irregularis]|nr:unnamed protein product [Rhizophagus irregularis]CAB5382173.1 unnamed protein product [Rhizophagus irregularis]
MYFDFTCSYTNYGLPNFSSSLAAIVRFHLLEGSCSAVIVLDNESRHVQILNVSGETVLRLAKCFAHLGFGFGHSETGETSKTKMCTLFNCFYSKMFKCIN